MNVRLIKETRELLPLLAGTLLLMVVPSLIWHGEAGWVVGLALAVGCAMLAGSAFGHEFHHRTMPLLLSQPLARSALWRDKMVVLGIAVLVAVTAAEVCQLVYALQSRAEEPFAIAAIGICAFCGAPFWTLVLRHGLHGSACAIGAPLALVMMLSVLAQRFEVSEDRMVAPVVILLVLYCTTVYWLGYRRFLRLEDVERPARELRLPAALESLLTRPLAAVGSRFRGPFATLLKKELRLQQTCFVLAGIFFVIAFGGFCLIHLHKNIGVGTVAFDFLVFMAILPLIAGVIAVTEEKAWDLAEWHLTLPPSALQQWWAKGLTALSTSFVLGLLLPAVMLLTGAAVLDPRKLPGSLPPAALVAGWVLGQMLLTTVALYAATLCRSAVKAILLAIGIAAAGFGLLLALGRWTQGLFGRSWLIHYKGEVDLVLPVLWAGLLLLAGLMQWLAWSNFRRLGTPARRWLPQLLLVLLAAGVVSLALLAAMYIAPPPARH